MPLYQNFLIISIFLSGLIQKIGFYNRLTETNTYRAAIVEYAVYSGNITIDLHTDNYIKLIAKAAKYDVDIIVFPECGLEPDIPLNTRNDYIELSTYVPDPKDKIVPYLDLSSRYAPYFKRLSRNAKKYQMYVTVNLDEMEDCDSDEDDSCHPDQLNLYNTNVVFDRNGTVIARYRKYHLYDEPQKNITKQPEFSYFDTDFSVRFGTFICFDILFQQPALNLTRNLNITDIIFTTEWYSSFPFENALQKQQAWAFRENVNLLASNLNDPPKSGSGSGIFHASKNLQDTMFNTIEKDVVTMLISDVVKKNSPTPKQIFTDAKQFKFDHKGQLVERLKFPNPLLVSRFDYYKMYLQDFTNFISIKIDPILQRQTHQLCAGEFCCKISIIMQTCSPAYSKNFYQYHFVIYNGLIDYELNYNNGKGGVDLCGLVACLNSSTESCGDYFDEYDSIDWPTSFKKITVEATFNGAPNISDFPNSVQTGFLPLNKDYWEYQKANQSHAKFTLVKPIKQILGFNIVMRNFTNDVPPELF